MINVPPYKLHTISFINAWHGIIHALKTQPNFFIHLIISISVLIAGSLITLSSTEWVIIVFTICLGLVIELINTSIETTVDLITSQYHPLAKVSKDTSAAAMLVYAIGATIVAVIIFIPRLL